MTPSFQAPEVRIGLGLAALGRPGYINLGHANDLQRDYDASAMERRAHAVLDEAYALGVRCFDAARSYGRAEAFLASWLESRSPKEVRVGSKWGYTYTAGWRVDAKEHEVKEHSLEKLNEQWRESRALLGEHLALYQIHSATLETGVLEDSAVLHRLAELKTEYGVRIGLTLSGPRQARALHRAKGVLVFSETWSGSLFDSVQATYNLLEPSVGETLQTAHDQGLSVIVKEALANGRLTSRSPDPELRAVLTAQAERLGTTIDALALAFVLREPWADIVLSGAATPEQLRSNLGALELALDEEALSALAALREPPEAYWQKRAGLRWN